MPTVAPRAGGIRRSRASAHGERGQALILMVMAATVIFVIGAIVVDIGLWVSQRRSAQAAADFAALAAATQLGDPVNPLGAADAKGLDFAHRNGYDDVLVRIPIASHDQVTVEVKEEGPGLFSGIFGILGPEIGATATASYTESPPGPDVALFASSDDCSAGSPTLDIQAGHLDVTGSTHSNASIYVQGPDDQFTGPITYVCPNNGFLQGSQQNFRYQPPPRMVSIQSPPVAVSWPQVPCTETVPAGSQIEVVSRLWEGGSPSSGRLKSNVICSEGDLALSGDGISGHVTLASHQGKVTILSTGSLGNQLQPADSLSGTPIADLLAFSAASTSSAAVEMTVTGGKYTGYIYAPDSRVVFNGGHVEINGAIVAETVLLAGANITIEALPGLPGPPGPPEIHLED